MRIYMSKYIADGNSYKKRVLFPIVCIIASLVAGSLVMGYTMASNGGEKTLPIQWMIASLLFLFVAMGGIFLLRVGGNAHRDALIFCHDNGTTIYVVDARACASSSRGFGGSRFYSVYKFFKIIVETGNIINRIQTGGMLEEDMRTGKINTYAAKITRITELQYVSGRKFAVCNITTNNGVKSIRKYDISNHTEELFELLKQCSLSKKWETCKKTYTKQICISGVLLLVCFGFCIASHPAVGLLPAAIYFPCLFALSIPLILLGIFILKRRKGE